MNLNYSIKLVQEITADRSYESVPTTTVNNIPDIEVNKDLLTYNLRTNESQTVYLNKDICGEFNNNKSVSSLSVPNSDDYKYLVKSGTEYSYVSERPLEYVHIDPLKYYATVPGFTYIPKEFRDHVAIRLQLSIYDESAYTAYSLNYGGISKANCFVFRVTLDGTMEDITYSEDVLIDHIEGFIYINSNSPLNENRLIGCIYNIDPIKIIPKGTFKIDRPSGFFKLVNVSNQQIVDVVKVDDGLLSIKALKNMFILPSNSITIDGLLYTDVKFVKKGETVLLFKSEFAKVFVNHLMNDINIIENLEQGKDSLGGLVKQNSGLLSNIQSTEESQDSLELIVELEKNTYNEANRYILQLNFGYIPIRR